MVTTTITSSAVASTAVAVSSTTVAVSSTTVPVSSATVPVSSAAMTTAHVLLSDLDVYIDHGMLSVPTSAAMMMSTTVSAPAVAAGENLLQKYCRNCE